ncbi:hypothetical protein GURASL_37330 [Geotalea uraniireducens]|uniref:Uncharacterized protein n=1 Tax=Geotalea uraniireducens TaxID=351604 RepID=A0ABN6VZG7_9BACT|nr:hypothetical protein [Geotalea uraniireducens]BDV44810.1 hypothetical protein GURASL_37330 [Geotalea uraniireducens]
MVVRWISVLLVVLFAGTGVATAAAPTGTPNQELLERIKNLENQIREMKDLQKQHEDQRLREKENQCMTAIGIKEFCGCLTANLPKEVDFTRYIQTVVGTQDKGVVPADMDKKLAERIFMTRDICTGKGK